MPEVMRYLIEDPSLNSNSMPNQELADKLEKFILNLGYNILNKSIDEDKIHLFVQTNDGLEELLIDSQLYTTPHFKEALNINKKINNIITDEFKDKDMLELLAKVDSFAKKGAYIQRYKGLGEMNPEQLWETTMTPENRLLLRVTIDDVQEASDTFSLFMGDEVEPRRNYIESHAKDVKHLDV